MFQIKRKKRTKVKYQLNAYIFVNFCILIETKNLIREQVTIIINK